MAKKVMIPKRPTAQVTVNALDADKFVHGGPKVPMVRMTIDLPADLHTRFKVHCAGRRVRMADVIRELVGQYVERKR